MRTKCPCMYRCNCRNPHSKRFTVTTRGKGKGWKVRALERGREKKGRNVIQFAFFFFSSFCKRVCPDWGYSCVLWEKGLMNIGAFPVHAEVFFSPLLSCSRGRHNFRFITPHSCSMQCSHVINVLDSIKRWCFCFWLAMSWGQWLTSWSSPPLPCRRPPSGDGRPYHPWSDSLSCRIIEAFVAVLLNCT